MDTQNNLFGMSLFDIRRRIAEKARCKTQDAIPAAHRLRSMVGALPGKTQHDKLQSILKLTKLTGNASATELLAACMNLWWNDIKAAIEPYDRAAHETHPRSIPVRRKYKKAKEYWTKYKFSKRDEFDRVLGKYHCKDVNFPYLTVVGTIYELHVVNHDISEWPLKSNVFDINDEDPIETLDDDV